VAFAFKEAQEGLAYFVAAPEFWLCLRAAHFVLSSFRLWQTPEASANVAGLERKGTDTPVVTGSMRNWLRPVGIEALRGAYDGGCKRDRMDTDVPPTRVFCEKRLQVIDSKGRARKKEGQEAAGI
jgi:hypothetical protein